MFMPITIITCWITSTKHRLVLDVFPSQMLIKQVVSKTLFGSSKNFTFIVLYMTVFSQRNQSTLCLCALMQSNMLQLSKIRSSLHTHPNIKIV